MATDERVDQGKPRCPRCGSREVREWDLVRVPYVVLELARNKVGEVFVADQREGGCPAWDGGRFDSLMCRDCDYESSDCAEFFPGAVLPLGES